MMKEELIRLIRQAQRERDPRKAKPLWDRIEKALVDEFNPCQDYQMKEPVPGSKEAKP